MSCLIYPQPDASFYSTGGQTRSTKNMRHTNLQVGDGHTRYVHYTQLHTVESLNLHHEHPNVVGVFPRNVYTKHPFGGSISHHIQPRGRNTHYTYSPDPIDGKERSDHTPWQSRFGYDRHPNEYGVGTQSRGYIEPAECNACHNDVPKEMAPVRFYSDKQTSDLTSV